MVDLRAEHGACQQRHQHTHNARELVFRGVHRACYVLCICGRTLCDDSIVLE